MVNSTPEEHDSKTPQMTDTFRAYPPVSGGIDTNTPAIMAGGKTIAPIPQEARA
ncbi:MAG: hypothetical protein LBE06_06665 [Azoarcus sp.]|nr:hypothetical protein [Azoarcus sp.]